MASWSLSECGTSAFRWQRCPPPPGVFGTRVHRVTEPVLRPATEGHQWERHWGLISRTDEDRRRFLGRVAELPERCGAEDYALALTDNHYYLLVRCRRADLGETLQWLQNAHLIGFKWAYLGWRLWCRCGGGAGASSSTPLFSVGQRPVNRQPSPLGWVRGPSTNPLAPTGHDGSARSAASTGRRPIRHADPRRCHGLKDGGPLGLGKDVFTDPRGRRGHGGWQRACPAPSVARAAPSTPPLAGQSYVGPTSTHKLLQGFCC